MVDVEKGDSSTSIDVENNGTIIELRNGECGGNESAKRESTEPMGREIKRPHPANNSQDEVAMATRNREQAEVAVDVRVMDTPADEETCNLTGSK